MANMKLLIGLLGFVAAFLGTLIALHFDFTVGLLVTTGGVFALWSMLPTTTFNRSRNDYR
tara:strand:+ start:196 stop:375 length:180 start_codon:yes stop_codon:yes gene_type:complete